ncbi:MBL fold metallo-hydrolase [Enterovirga rhinocerotis]|uniref:Metallo-beta-lactamase superfamily protein n=1 Tax=Enterovirga rhinocerotis TaxID=1339210 RepID=A0A4R7C9D3_9HYPH|nr:MBL fold metallo-hydrolase [Enterovirga rhinocerotis]TDR93347.1 metallo-beta-lactamase superfamily protein [Enterovirga rhinocerotis]
MTKFRIGDVTVQSIWEMDDTSFAMRSFFPASDDAAVAAEIDWIAPQFYDPQSGMVRLSIHAWLIETSRSRILVDTCVGNDKERPSRPQWHRRETPFLDRLAAAGIAPESIDYVLCTHLHADHVGWNTRLLDGRWVPTFPHAKYVFGRAEYDHWERVFRSAEPGAHHLAAYADSVLPVIEAGQALVVDDGFVIDDRLTVEPAPGHTPGHIAVWLRSNGSSGAFTGDVIHHPIQLCHPDWSCSGCQDPALSARTRRRILERLADTDTLLMTGHFVAPHAGHVLSRGEAFGFRFLCEEA